MKMLKLNVNLLIGECLNTFCINVDFFPNIVTSKNVKFLLFAMIGVKSALVPVPLLFKRGLVYPKWQN